MQHCAIKNQTVYKSIVGNEKMQIFVTLKGTRRSMQKQQNQQIPQKLQIFQKLQKLKILANFVTQQGLGMKHTTYIMTLGPGNSKIITL